ncbi:sugar ABC transporter substrate-binding protein [Mesorhizobium sp.]|uniref:sugar ABC transporter substrate-binding protein n=1 Tax=Mesorhizobium sp. TaxID=1871066 RepID=UPI000FE8858E|nr:sugar ABC transporter substrate-binding protein [Mesorhizobium sp.]RWI87910.1 MAG: sugar ABC transporter substrate-binding protein [Mesorhizobium sp.]
MSSKYLTSLTGLAALLLSGTASFAAATDLDAIKANIEAHQKLPAFVAPGEAFDAKPCMQDKKLMVVPFSSAVEFTGGVATRMTEIAKEIGFRYDHYQTQGQPSQWIQGINQAITQHYNLVDVLMSDPRVLVPQATQADQAGVKIVAAHASGFDTPAPAPFQNVQIDYTRAGELMAQWAVLKTKGKANVLAIVAEDSFSANSLKSGIKSVMDKCEGCKVQYLNVPVTDWATRMQSTVQSALLRDPSINYILPIYDGMAQFVVPAVELTQSADRVKIATFNGSPYVLQLVQQGRVEMDIGESIDWVAHAIIDAEMRMLCGLPPVKDPKVPLYIFDASNAASAGTPPKISTGYGDAYVAGYRKLWGLQ